MLLSIILVKLFISLQALKAAKLFRLPLIAASLDLPQFGSILFAIFLNSILIELYYNK
jgi:hypothetical protein